MTKESWATLDITNKIKLSLASILIVASIVLGFVSFFVLNTIPNSVLAMDGEWLATACAILGISMYFHNSLVNYQTKLNKEIKDIDERIKKID
jgi:hypothetical protein